MRAHITALTCCLIVATSIANVALASPTITQWPPRNTEDLRSATADLFKQANSASKFKGNPDYAYDVQARYDSVRADLIKTLPTMNPYDAADLLESYANVLAPVLTVALTQTPFEKWDYRAIVAKMQVKIPHANFTKILEAKELPRNLWVSSFTSNDVIVAPTPTLVFSTAMRQLAAKISDQNYERMVHCLAGFAYATKYSDAYLHSKGAAQVEISQKLVSLSNRPFCLNVTFPDLAAELAGRSLFDDREKMARYMLLNLVPGTNSMMPISVKNILSKGIRLGDKVVDLKDAWIYLSIAPEAISDRQKDDGPNVLSSQDVKSLAADLSNLDVNFLKGDEALFTTVDSQLVNEVKDVFNTRLNDKELGRRLRVGQIAHLRQNLENRIRAFYIDKPDLTNAVFERFFPLLNISLNYSIQDTLGELFGSQIGKDKVDPFKVKTLAERALQRWQKRTQNSALLNNWLNQTAQRVAQMSSPLSIVQAQSEAFVSVLRESAKQLDAIAGSKISDENLMYDPTAAVGMLSGEIKQSSVRVQKWFDYLLTASSYEQVTAYQSEVEAHIKKALIRPDLCDFRPQNWADRTTRAWNAFSKAVLNGVGSIDKGMLSQDELDCQTFVRLSTFAQLRGLKSKPKDMSASVAALEYYSGKDYRAPIIETYRRLLRLKGLDQHRILDIAVSDKQTLEQVLLASDGASDAFSAIARTMDNIETNMRELLDAKKLDDLAPFIVRSSFLDQSFIGLNELLRTQTGQLSDVASLLQGINELIKQHKFAELTDFQGKIDTASDIFLAWNRFHGMKKAKYAAIIAADRTRWESVYRDSVDAVYWVMGMVLARRAASWIAPNFAGSRWYFEYMAENRQLAQGYFSFLTLPFVGDGAYQYFYTIPELDSDRQYDEKLAHTELSANGAQFMGARNMLQHDLERTLQREDAESRIRWSFAMAALPLLPSAFRLANKGFEAGYATYWKNTELQWAIWEKTNPAKLNEEIFKISRRESRKLGRIMSYNPRTMEYLGINLRGEPLAELHLDNVKKAFQKTLEAAKTPEAKVQALVEYRRVLQDLYDVMGKYHDAPTVVERVRAQIYGGGGEANYDYIKKVVEEYNRVVLGL